MFHVGDIVRLNRHLYRGRFRYCKGRVGKIIKVVRLKNQELSHHTYRFYVVDGLIPYTTKEHYVTRLKLLGDDLERVDKDLWEQQQLIELLEK